MTDFNAALFVQDLMLAGLKIQYADDKLKVDTSGGVLTDAHRATIREHKDDILAYLTGKDAKRKTVMQLLREREYNPKAARAMIHMMLYRCAMIVENCPMDSRLECLAKMWLAHEKMDKTSLATSLENLELRVTEYAQSARHTRSTVGTG
jgi:hypothetical protein